MENASLGSIGAQVPSSTSLPGFTLLELTLAMATMALFAAVGTNAYQHHVVRLQLEEARAALLQNAHFLEAWYASHGSFKAAAHTWPRLPITATSHFRITFLAAADNTPSDKFRLYACPNPSNKTISHYLVLDQDGIIKTCSLKRQGRRCD